MPDTRPAIRFEAISHAFAARDGAPVLAVQNVALDVAVREFVCVVGPSGCGKSTLLRMVSGLLIPTRGTVSVFGLPVTEPRDDIGLVFQKPTLLPWLDTLANVTFPIRHKGRRVGAAERDGAMELLRLVGLGDFSAKMPHELSGGMQQRAALCRALMQDPDILLMDEPFAALDALSREEMSFEILRIWEERRKTVVFVTHSIPEAVTLADRVVVMTPRPGRIDTVVDIDLPRPRTMDVLSSFEFQQYAKRLREHIFGYRRVPAAAE